MKNNVKLLNNGDLVKFSATGRAYKMLTGTVVEIVGDAVKISITGMAYKIVTRSINNVSLA